MIEWSLCVGKKYIRGRCANAKVYLRHGLFSYLNLHVPIPLDKILNPNLIFVHFLQSSKFTTNTLSNFLIPHSIKHLSINTYAEMSSTVLGDKDVNAAQTLQATDAKPDIKSMEYHRQVLQSRLEEDK